MNAVRLMAAIVVITATTVFAGPRPARVMSGYTGYFLGGGGREHVEKMIDRLAENGFNAIDVKVHSNYGRKKFIDGCWQEVKALVDRAHAKGLAFNVYLYPISSSRRADWPEHAALPVPVDATGSRAEGAFLISDPASWRVFYCEALRFAALRRQIGFDTLRFDIETLPNSQTSYDDGTWAKFCAANRGLDAKTPAAGRAAALAAKKAQGAYAAFCEARIKSAVVDFVAAVRAADPGIELGYMPVRDTGSVPKAFNEMLATPSNPAWMDGWDLYNGGGYKPSVKARNDYFKKVNPNNRFVTWICPNRYKPEDVAASVYHAAVNTDGYSIWVLCMLDEDHKYSKGLPKGTTCADYWAAFKKANEALRADMAEGTLAKAARIAPIKVKPLVAQLSWNGVTAPALAPAGDGTGKDVTLTLRTTQNLFLYAKAGQPMRIAIRHLSGQARPGGLQYVLLSPSGKVMRNEAVTASENHSFTVKAEETGAHILRVTGGDVGGSPWYSVCIASPIHWAVDARREAYMFRAKKFYVPGSDMGNPKMHLRFHQTSCTLYINGEPHDCVRVQSADFDLPPGVVEIAIGRSPAGHGENYWVSFPGGKSPFVYPVKERRLGLKKEVAK